MQYASRKDVERAIKDWTIAVLACRLRGHDWPIGKGVTAVPTSGGWIITEWCRRKCGVHRWYFMSKTGHTERSHSIYPRADGVEFYLLKGLGRVDVNGRAAIRLAALSGMTIGRAEE